MFTILGLSKVRKVVVHHAPKDEFVIVFLRRVIMWLRMLFTILWSQNPSILCWTWFLALFQLQAGAVDRLWPFKGEEMSGQCWFLGFLCDSLLEKNHNVVEGVVYDTLITKSFYFVLNMVFGSFSTPGRSWKEKISLSQLI